MTNNKSLIQDYIERAELRFEVLRFIYEKRDYADVIVEAQKIVELTSRALVRRHGLKPLLEPETSAQLLEIQKSLDSSDHPGLLELIDISKTLRRDRELAFYGSEDLTPSEFYS